LLHKGIKVKAPPDCSNSRYNLGTRSTYSVNLLSMAMVWEYFINT